MAIKQVICMNWGDAYGAEYVNRLYNMVRRNTTGDIRMVEFSCEPDEDGRGQALLRRVSVRLLAT